MKALLVFLLCLEATHGNPEISLLVIYQMVGVEPKVRFLQNPRSALHGYMVSPGNSSPHPLSTRTLGIFFLRMHQLCPKVGKLAGRRSASRWRKRWSPRCCRKARPTPAQWRPTSTRPPAGSVAPREVLNEWTNERMSEWKNERMNKRTNEWMND